MNLDEVRWGILGPGRIARSFARGLQDAAGARLVAVGSRDLDRARAFAAEFGLDRAYGSYASLVEDPEVDAIYVSSPHSEHEAHTILCLQAGKHVLCEKPLALNAAQARRMIDVARENDRALMEALWTRFLPAVIGAREQGSLGAIGEVRMVRADFGFRAEPDPRGRLLNPELGGGALLDLGIYPLNLAFMFCGKPTEISAKGNLGPTGVDEESAILLRHRNGELSQLSCSLRVDIVQDAEIIGTGGRMTIEFPWWGASRFAVHGNDGNTEEFAFDHRGGGYTYEAEAFMDLIRSGRRDSDVMPLSESVAILETMDEIRAMWKLRYPGE
jgi:predicted dehydrogenase